MQDVSAPPVEMGPVEEIRYMTLTDFRRLSGKPEEAARRLGQKFITLQEESFVLFLDALAAYHQSPLYADCVVAISQSLANRKPLSNILSDRGKIQLNELVALMEMEKGL